MRITLIIFFCLCVRMLPAQGHWIISHDYIVHSGIPTKVIIPKKLATDKIICKEFNQNFRVPKNDDTLSVFAITLGIRPFYFYKTKDTLNAIDSIFIRVIPMPKLHVELNRNWGGYFPLEAVDKTLHLFAYYDRSNPISYQVQARVLSYDMIIISADGPRKILITSDSFNLKKAWPKLDLSKDFFLMFTNIRCSGGGIVLADNISFYSENSLYALNRDSRQYWCSGYVVDSGIRKKFEYSKNVELSTNSLFSNDCIPDGVWTFYAVNGSGMKGSFFEHKEITYAMGQVVKEAYEQDGWWVEYSRLNDTVFSFVQFYLPNRKDTIFSGKFLRVSNCCVHINDVYLYKNPTLDIDSSGKEVLRILGWLRIEHPIGEIRYFKAGSLQFSGLMVLEPALCPACIRNPTSVECCWNVERCADIYLNPGYILRR